MNVWLRCRRFVRAAGGVSLLACWSVGASLPNRTLAADQPQVAGATTPSDQRIDRLIEQLGDKDYFVRQWAQEELARLRLEAFDALTLAENNDDIEVAERARYLVRLLRVEPVLESDPPEVKKILEPYESADEKARIEIVSQLASLSENRGLPALCRLLRFDRSQQVSKEAALKLIEQKPLPEEQWPQRQAQILEGIGRSPRPAAEWLRAWVATRTDPPAAAAAWSRLAFDETQVLRQQPHQSRPEIVLGLLKQEVLSLRQQGRDDDAQQAMRKMIALEPDDNQVLGEMLAWLVEQKAWSVVDEAAKRFADRFEQEPLLLYTLAEACQAQGNVTLAEETAHRALQFHEGNMPQHLILGTQLQRRGLMKWAEAEYRRSIAIGPAGERPTLFAQTYLGELLHDLGRDLDAGKVYEERATAIEEQLNAGRQGEDLKKDLGLTRGQMHYFYACDAQQNNHPEKHREQLLKGLEHDPTNADVLIALYRLPDAEPALRQTTLKKIREAAEIFRNEILQAPDNSTPYNQLAWLIANTEGDYQEALRCSQKSLELQPNAGGYLDTLGRCYYALGDYENAVKAQTQAVELEPHSTLIKRQLDLFRKALEASKNKK